MLILLWRAPSSMTIRTIEGCGTAGSIGDLVGSSVAWRLGARVMPELGAQRSVNHRRKADGAAEMAFAAPHESGMILMSP
jgi:hypothetical protein